MYINLKVFKKKKITVYTVVIIYIREYISFSFPPPPYNKRGYFYFSRGGDVAPTFTRPTNGNRPKVSLRAERARGATRQS